MFNLFPVKPKKKFIIYDNSLNSCYEVRVDSVDDDEKLKRLIPNSRLFLKIENTYYYRTITV